MRTFFTLLVLLLATGSSNAQTATNFNSNDCSGTPHELFSELDSGKVIVLVWVMPCGACAGPATTAYNTVQSYQAAQPGKVLLYLVDDYANTSCSNLNSWANGLGILQQTWSLRFSDPDIDMLDYGSTGMPKTVVVGGAGHSVYYNVNNTINQTALQNAINTALSATGIQEANGDDQLNVFPNPATEIATVTFTLTKSANISISLYDLQGKLTGELYTGLLKAGTNEFTFSTDPFPANHYLIKINDGEQVLMQKLTIAD